MSEEVSIRNQRDQINTLEKQVKALTGERDTLATENRQFAVRNAFVDEGYSAEHAELFASVNEGEATSEAIDTFVTKYGLSQQGTTDSEEATETDGGGDQSDSGTGSSKLAGMSGGGSGAGSGGADGAGGESLTRQEWQALYATDPAAANDAVRQGRVQVSSVDTPVAPGVNPFDKSPE